MIKKVGFIGQGFIGKAYSDDFESRGIEVVRYSLDPDYVANRNKISECDFVFIAVNAGTKPRQGEKRDDGVQKTYFDDSNILSVIPLTKSGATVIIKSTLPPGKTRKLQELFPDRNIFHSPEFLTETTASEDAKNPLRNIVGIPNLNEENIAIAKQILEIFPKSKYEKICESEEAELIKYGANAFLFVKILFSNVFCELVEKYGQNWNSVAEALGVDPRIGTANMSLHLKGDPEKVMNRRGAGRSCFIKDMAELSEIYSEELGENKTSINFLRAMEYKNAELLRKYNRYIDILESVYGKDFFK
jgi:UDP-glucose 6-dehydrogenase